MGAPASRSEPIRIAVHGTGRMAKAIAGVVAAGDRSDISLVALVGPAQPDWETDLTWCAGLDELPAKPDLLIDFTLPEGTLAAAAWCRTRGVALLSGVTGLSPPIHATLRASAEAVPVLWSPNLSLGVNLLAELAGRAAAVLDPDVPVVIEDIHHQWKKDAPSGTALMLGATVAEQREGDQTAIEYRSVREGEVIGEHTVTFRLAGEEFGLTHRARDRTIYALGALDAGKWLVDQPAGLYSARDWLARR
jgi:4-hydroxy-tetrahydrodipicolinate reductase